VRPHIHISPKPAGTASLLLLLLAACAVNPVTGERELALISESQEISMGAEAATEVRSSIGLVQDEALQRYVDGIGQRLAAMSERPHLPWSFQVVDDPTPNAFALPGGYIFVTRGLMTLLNSEGELAAVLGHEIGHVTARHSVSQLSRAQLAELGLGIGAIAAPESAAEIGQIAGAGVSLLFLRYGRDDERQADELGFGYMLEQGYRVAEMRDVFAALDAASALAGASPVPAWLATHPSGTDRIAALDARLATLAPGQAESGVSNASAYLDRVDGLAYGANPRHGYFDGNAFYHPDLAFEIHLPDGWRRQNTTAAVLAQSPDGAAAMQLTLARETDPGAATAALRSEPGFRELASSRTRINGNAAVVTRFAIDPESGMGLEGLAAHIDHDDRIYRILIYARAGAFGQLEATAERVAGSFAPLSDRDILDVRSPRLNIVALDREMTLLDFSRRFPSVVPIEEVAIINQVEGPSSRLTPETGAKQVTS